VDDQERLEQIIAYLQDTEWSSARQMGRVIEGGKRPINSLLYRHLGTLFEKRGLTPPLWRVISEQSSSIKRIEKTDSRPAATPGKRQEPPRTWVSRVLPARNRVEVPLIDTCGSCGRPIQSSGKCGCS
jgi:hypothetical protein